MDNSQQQVVEALKSASNILVTVSTDPSVDGLSAALGLTLLLDKLDKRATAIFSGTIPSAINFLEPDKTFENTADSLRDFIIALDKEKADHLRYKVDGDVVKIFITPYKTMLSQSDLEFSQGDYNVELIIALGVTSQDNLDKALDAHGKILHDAKVVTITAGETASNLGGVDWNEKSAGSLSEMVVALSTQMSGEEKLIDEQIATALLTGIVSATDRFSNDRTTSRVMTMAAQLMAAGANQQLIAAKLEEGHDIAPGSVEANPQTQDTPVPAKKDNNSELFIDRKDNTSMTQNENPSTPVKDDAEITQKPSEQSVESIENIEASLKQEATTDDNSQIELERELAGIVQPSSNPTLADIEKELKQETIHEVIQPEPLTTPLEATMPGFEATEPPKSQASAPAENVVDNQSTAIQSTLAPEVVAEPTFPPEIVTNHDANEAVSSEPLPPINSALNPDMSDETVVNPFDLPQESNEGISVNPVNPGFSGTPEGAALLATPPASATSTTVQPPVLASNPAINEGAEVATQPVAALEVPELPPLPPLPPLPTDGSVLPPPLPPAPPVFGDQGGAMPSGAVSGDVFGDGSGSTEPPASTPNEPGIFKIPGQP